jgi:hypothetical protein
MAESAPQSFENHTRIVPVFLAILFIFAVNLVATVIRFARLPTYGTAIGVLVAAALFASTVYARRFALTVQDRVIRLEMRLRLKEVLPADLKGRIDELTLRQLVALRFASDAELPDLCRTVLTDKTANGKAIKKMIKHWQADHLRA